MSTCTPATLVFFYSFSRGEVTIDLKPVLLGHRAVTNWFPLMCILLITSFVLILAHAAKEVGIRNQLLVIFKLRFVQAALWNFYARLKPCLLSAHLLGSFARFP